MSNWWIDESLWPGPVVTYRTVMVTPEYNIQYNGDHQIFDGTAISPHEMADIDMNEEIDVCVGSVVIVHGFLNQVEYEASLAETVVRIHVTNKQLAPSW